MPISQPRLSHWNPSSRAWCSARAATVLEIESLALPDEDPARWRALHDAWADEFPPATIGDATLLKQVLVALIDRERCLQARTSRLAEKVRTAELRFDLAQQDEVETYRTMLPDQPAQALDGLLKSAAGCRYLIGRWERLGAILSVEGTWYGQDRDEATLLQGFRAGTAHLAESETAYVTMFYCLLAQPAPRTEEISKIGDHALMPKAFQDRDPDLWIPIRPHCRLLLPRLVAHELAPLRAREEWLRKNVEEPARAAAREQARVHIGTDRELLRSERFHDQAFRQAYQALLKGHRPGDTADLQTAYGPAPQPPRPGLITSPLPPSNRAAGAVFLDFHTTCRAVVAEVDWPNIPGYE